MIWLAYHRHVVLVSIVADMEGEEKTKRKSVFCGAIVLNSGRANEAISHCERQIEEHKYQSMKMSFGWKCLSMPFFSDTVRSYT